MGLKRVVFRGNSWTWGARCAGRASILEPFSGSDAPETLEL